MLEVIKSDNLDESHIRHGFFTNRGGVSEGIYSSLNVGLGSCDTKSQVRKNRRLARAHLANEKTPLCTLFQCHSNRAITVDETWNEGQKIEADAMVTARTGIIIGVLTADCVPILLADNKAGIVAVAHAGWKGALNGIIDNTILEMERLGATRSSIRAATGPAIQQESYEVGPELRQSFLDASPDYLPFFAAGKNGRFQLDLPGIVGSRIEAAGITDFIVSAIDTYAAQDRFFSYRRSVHRNELDYGRQLSAICRIDREW